ncbi:MAG: hypothetical protein EA342_11880 [Leptolyngbya sp. LCM1.Bin17]|nr:MAG: hypothetical protein EA342_11880 [Leptolyngbya sp. LCM1.Bin17]
MEVDKEATLSRWFKRVEFRALGTMPPTQVEAHLDRAGVLSSLAMNFGVSQGFILGSAPAF